MDTKKLNTIMTVTKFALVAIGVIACILIVGGPNASDTKEEIDAFREGGAMSLASGYTGFIIIATTAAVLLFFIIQLISNTKKTAMSIAGVLVALVVYLLILMIGTSDSNVTLELRESVQVTQSTINSASAGLYTALVGVIVGGLAWVLSPLMGRYRK